MSSYIIAALLECFRVQSSCCRNEQICRGWGSVKHFEWSNGLDTGLALYKNMIFFISF